MASSDQPNPHRVGAQTRQVVAIGAANMDISGATHNTLLAGDSSPGRIRCEPGGVARNVAENLARLGCAVQLMCAVGDDLFGRSVLAATRDAGVAVDHCWVLGDQGTSTYLSLHGPDGEMQAAVNDMAILDAVTPQRLAQHAELVCASQVLVLDCNLPASALDWLFANAPGVPVFIDPVSVAKAVRLRPWLRRVHTLKANRHEAQVLSGQSVDHDAAVVRAGEWFHAQGVQQLVLSLGDRGLYWSHRGGPSGWQAALPVDVVSATGAGDALLAGLVQQHLAGEPLARAARFAAGCAALTLAVPGANNPRLSPESVERLLAAHAS